MSYVAEGRVGGDGTATMTYAHDTAYDTYSLNACFYPDDSSRYTSSQDFNCCLKVTMIPTTTVRLSPSDDAVAQTGKPVTLTARGDRCGRVGAAGCGALGRRGCVHVVRG